MIYKILTNSADVFYYIIFLFLAGMAFLFASDVIGVMTASPSELKNYPFGTEQGYRYYSKETYLATGLLFDYIAVQSLVVSFLFKKWGHKVTALIVILLPVSIYISSFFYEF